jgi:translocator assembly and maintenance protein 41
MTTMAGTKSAVALPSLYSKILDSTFPQHFSFCFAYGSGVFRQTASDISKNMIDMIFTVEDPAAWHKENISRNPSHYSALRFLGHKTVARVQENWGAKVYFNALVPIKDAGVTIKYGVVSRSALVTDLLDWNKLYLAGRLHKPVEIIRKTSDAELRSALQLNLHSAVHTALLMLPENFSEHEFYITVSSLSYSGDFRMIFGEDKKKVQNIVDPQMEAFRELYSPVINSLSDFLEVSKESGLCSQDSSPVARIHHLNQLPRAPQRAIVRLWNRDSRKLRQDTEDTLRAIAYDPDCGLFLLECIKYIVSASSIKQSLKGILTAGIFKSLRYSGKKILKMIKS